MSSLQMNSWYKLKTLQKNKQASFDSEITPECLKLRGSAANFYEVYIKNPQEDFYLQLMMEKSNKIWEKVWEAPIRENDFSVVPKCVSSLQRISSSSHVVHFVDKHMNELIQRVALVSPISDDLKLLIGDEKYSVIRQGATTQDQMRMLYSFLTGGQELKETFYKSLQKNEPCLVEELQRSVRS
ncbi:NACHT, LRR and PYD domains-containing protein 1b allele 2-like [Hoplias malabaricus]|uniref:NACHT, LRR and PYD domains-containing protein 1b allele 2-like n=1 Tax=Hoplias malabaricus TaxID=27720 RepID=UPI0034620BA3